MHVRDVGREGLRTLEACAVACIPTYIPSSLIALAAAAAFLMRTAAASEQCSGIPNAGRGVHTTYIHTYIHVHKRRTLIEGANGLG